MKKKILVVLSCLLLCCTMILTLSACVNDRDKKKNDTPMDAPASVEVDDNGEVEGEIGSDIIVTPKDSDMDIEIIPKDPDIDIEITPAN